MRAIQGTTGCVVPFHNFLACVYCLKRGFSRITQVNADFKPSVMDAFPLQRSSISIRRFSAPIIFIFEFATMYDRNEEIKEFHSLFKNFSECLLAIQILKVKMCRSPLISFVV